MNKYWKMRLITIIVLLFSIALSAENIQEVHYQIENDTIWYPSTTSHDSKSVVQIADDVYFPVDGGLATYNILKDSLYVYPCPIDYTFPISTGFSVFIRSIIQIDNKLWIGFQGKGIWIFDLITKEFTERYELENIDEFAPYGSIRFAKDPYSNTIWILCYKNVHIYEPDTGKLTNLKALFNNSGTTIFENRGHILFDIDNVWFPVGANKYSKSAMLIYNKNDKKIHSFNDELSNIENPKHIYIQSTFQFENKLYLEVNSGVYYHSIAEYNKTSDEWITYNHIKLLDVISEMRARLTEDEFALVMKTSFFVSALKDLKVKHRYVETKDVPENYYLNYSEVEVDKIISEFEDTDDFEILQWINQNDTSEPFLYDNQLVFADEDLLSLTYQDFTDSNNMFLYPLAETENGIVLVTDTGLEVLNTDTHTISHIEGSETFHFGRGETTASYDNIEDCIYIFQIVGGHDNRYYLVKFNIQTFNFEDITPVESIYYHYKKESVWSMNNELYVNTHEGLYKYNNIIWEKTNRIIESRKTFKSLPSELTLRNGSKAIVKSSGLFIIENPK